MKNTKANILKLLKVRREVTSKYRRTIDNEQYKKSLLKEIMELDTVIRYFEDEKYFEQSCKLWLK